MPAVQGGTETVNIRKSPGTDDARSSENWKKAASTRRSESAKAAQRALASTPRLTTLHRSLDTVSRSVT